MSLKTYLILMLHKEKIMNKKQLKIITKEYAECYTKLLDSEIKRLIKSEAIEEDIDWERAYELRRAITRVALENVTSRIWDLKDDVKQDYDNLKKVRY